MKESIERAWVSSSNSGGFRRFAKQGLSSRVFRTESCKRLLAAKNYVTTYQLSHANRAQYKGVKTLCVYIGPTKSGSTMTGSLLDTHPNNILADEADAHRYVVAGFNEHQIFQILPRPSRRHAMIEPVTARR